MEQHHRVLGLDPAIKNFGFSMLEIREDKTAWRIIECGLLQHPINAIGEDLRDSLDTFTYEMRRMIQVWRPADVVIERFQNRSRVGASQTEKVNIMIGLAAYMADSASCNVHALTAASWKNKVNASADLDKIYLSARSAVKDLCKSEGIAVAARTALLGKTPHSVDSTILALFIGCQKAGIDPFRFINPSVGVKVARALVRMVQPT